MNPRNTSQIEADIAPLVARAEELGAKMKRQNGELSDTEGQEFRQINESLEPLVTELQNARSNAPWTPTQKSAGLLRILGKAHGRSFVPSPFADAVEGAGFNIKSNRSVKIPLATIVEQKANSFPAVANWPSASPEMVPLGQDSRFITDVVQHRDVGSELNISDWRQSGRALTGTVQRALDASTVKADVASTVALVSEPLSQFATTVSSVPNAILESIPLFRDFLTNEARFQVMKALDQHIMSQIVAAAPPFGVSGTGLIAQVRNGISEMRAVGATPNVIVLNPTDSATLDLSTSGTGTDYLFAPSGGAGSLWGLRVVERAGSGSEPPYLIDTAALGLLYSGTARLDVDPYSQFTQNLSTLRFEIAALYHVRNAEGARRIAAS